MKPVSLLAEWSRAKRDSMATRILVAAKPREGIPCERICVMHGEFLGDRLRLVVDVDDDNAGPVNLAVVDYFGASGGAQIVESDLPISAALTARIEREVDNDTKIHRSFLEHMERAADMEDRT